MSRKFPTDIADERLKVYTAAFNWVRLNNQQIHFSSESVENILLTALQEFISEIKQYHIPSFSTNEENNLKDIITKYENTLSIPNCGKRLAAAFVDKKMLIKEKNTSPLIKGLFMYSFTSIPFTAGQILTIINDRLNYSKKYKSMKKAKTSKEMIILSEEDINMAKTLISKGFKVDFPDVYYIKYTKSLKLLLVDSCRYATRLVNRPPQPNAIQGESLISRRR